LTRPDEARALLRAPYTTEADLLQGNRINLGYTSYRHDLPFFHVLP
jgi:hypothetical protein